MRTNALLSVRVSKRTAQRLADLAAATERSKSYVAGQAIEEFLALHEWQVQAIRQGISEADAGKLLPHSDAVRRLKKWSKGGP